MKSISNLTSHLKPKTWNLKSITLFLLCLWPFMAKAQKGQYVGGDISMLPAYEEHNSGYLDERGQKIDDLLTWFRDDCGWNTMRVRLFVNPSEKAGSREGVIQNLDYVKALGKRIKDAGMSFMLDFHYSDTWADPVKQKLPAAWSDCTTAEQKAERLYQYTKESLEALVAAGAKPDLVQVGNEISYGIIGIQVHPYDKDGDDWNGMLKVLSSGCKAVREVCPEAKIIIHTERAGNATQTIYYYNKLKNLDYDVIGLSYYPFWHQSLSVFGATLSQLQTSFPEKDVQVVETAYYFQYFPTGDKNTTNTTDVWPATADGQYAYVKDLMAELSKHDNVKGMYYWFPEEAGCGDDSNWNTNVKGSVIESWLNRGMWWEDQTQTGHWPVVAKQGFVGKLMGGFVDKTGIVAPSNSPKTERAIHYNILGQRMEKGRGIQITNGKKVVQF